MRWRRVWFADMVVDRHHKCDANICLMALTCPGVLFLTALITAIKKLWVCDVLHSDWVPCAIGSQALGGIGHLSAIWLQITYWSEIIMPAAGVMSWSRYTQSPEQRTEHWSPLLCVAWWSTGRAGSSSAGDSSFANVVDCVTFFLPLKWRGTHFHIPHSHQSVSTLTMGTANGSHGWVHREPKAFFNPTGKWSRAELNVTDNPVLEPFSRMV